MNTPPDTEPQALRDHLGEADLLRRFDQVLAERAGEPFETQLEAMLRALLENFEAHPRFPRVLSETMDALYSRFETLAQRGLSAGSLQAEYATSYPELLMGMLRRLLVHALSGLHPPGSIAEQAPQLVDIFLNGAGRRP